MDALRTLKEKGVIRAYGMSLKTVVSGSGLQAVADSDIVIATCNLAYQNGILILKAAAEQNKGVLVKKALQSGHIHKGSAEEAMCFIFA